MHITINASHTEVTSAIRDYVEEKISVLEKVNDRIIGATVHISPETSHHNKGEDLFKATAEIQLPGKTLHGAAKSGDLYAAIDELQDELRNDLRRQKEKQRDRERQPRPDKA